ncbi:MAG: ROK family protein [Thermomicrobiales bacterium]
MSERKVIAVDLGGTRIRVALVTEGGELVHRVDDLAHTEEGPRKVTERMAGLIQRLVAETGIDGDIPVGIGSPGPLNPRTGTVLYTPNLPGWRDVPLVDWLNQLTGRRVALQNDGNCGTLGEMQFGSAKGVRDLVYLALGTGVGGGIVSGGRLVDGVRGLGAEVGHFVVALDGPRCSCGSVGCLESFTAGWAIKREAEAVCTTRDGDFMVKLADGKGLHAGIVAEAARQGDPAATMILDRAARALGASMGAFVNLTNPSMIVFGGGLIAIKDVLIEPAKRYMAQHCFADFRDDVTVTYSSLGHDTGVYGAAALALIEFPA